MEGLASSDMNWNEILSRLREIVSQEHLISDLESLKQESKNTLGAEREIVGIIRPKNISEVQRVLKIANQFKFHMYPISSGRNWGYGSALPIRSPSILLDLSRLNRIISFDRSLGVVTVEPGVTQRQLHDFFLTNGLDYMVPTTGAGPDCSILGNALERGYGITPIEDHFAAVQSIKAVLPNGQIYHSALWELGGRRVDSIFKWNVGPYVDGLFAQGNFGIVVQASIALIQRSENVSQVVAFVDDEHLEDAVRGIRDMKQAFRSNLGGLNLMNKRRLLAMIESGQGWTQLATMPETAIRSLGRERRIPDWVIMGGIYGTDEVSSAVKTEVKRRLSEFSKQVIVLDRKRLSILRAVQSVFPIEALKRMLLSLTSALDILDGAPSEVALPLAYLKTNLISREMGSISDRINECGLIWFAPLLPIEAPLVRDFTQEVTRICLAHDVEPLITLTSISERCFDSTIPILFDQTHSVSKDNARRCFNHLMKSAVEFGFFPYRLDIESLARLYSQPNSVSDSLVSAIKLAVDPNNVLAPGRYVPANPGP